MKKVDLLKMVNSPITEEKAYELIKFFYTQADDDLYKSLNYKWSSDKAITTQEELIEKENTLLLKVYNFWKKRMLSLTDEQIAFVEKSLPDIRSKIEEIKNLPEFTDTKVFAEYMNKNKYLKGLYPAIYDQDGSFKHIFGNKMTGFRTGSPDEQIRFYLSTNEKNTVDLVYSIIEKAMKNNLPFYLKFASASKKVNQRVDQIIIYTEYGHVMEYKRILEEIISEKPELFQNYKKLNPMWGEFNEYIGIGDQPEDRGSSFGFDRSLLLSESMTNTTNILLKRALRENPEIDRGGNKIKFEDRFRASIRNSIYKKMCKYQSFNVDDLKSKPELENLRQLVGSYTESIIDAYKSGKDPASIKIDNGLRSMYYSYDEKGILDEIAPTLYNKLYKNEFYDIFIDQINQLSDKYKVFPENITFNKDIENELPPDEKDKIYAERYLTSNRAKGILDKVTKEKVLNTLREALQGNEVVKNFKGQPEWAMAVGKVVGEENGLTVEYTQNEKGEMLLIVNEKEKKKNKGTLQENREEDIWAETPEETLRQLEAIRRDEAKEAIAKADMERLLKIIDEKRKETDIPDDPTDPGDGAIGGSELAQVQAVSDAMKGKVYTTENPEDPFTRVSERRPSGEKIDRIQSLQNAFISAIENQNTQRKVSKVESPKNNAFTQTSKSDGLTSQGTDINEALRQSLLVEQNLMNFLHQHLEGVREQETHKRKKDNQMEMSR